MEKDPKKLTPGNPFNKTYPGQDLNNGVAPYTTEMLPVVFRTETNKKVLSAILEDLFQPSSIETLNYVVGRTPTPSFGPGYLPHPTARRQGEVGLAYFSAAETKTLTADNIADSWNLNDRVNEQPAAISILDLPIDTDKFLNWFDYYWIEERMPVLYLTGGKTEAYSVQQDIIGKKYFTLPTQSNGNTLELKNGMRIAFQQYPGQVDVNCNLDIDFVASGKDEDQFADLELINYDRGLIGIAVDGQLKYAGTDYEVIASSIHWKGAAPQAGQTIHAHFPDFYLTPEAEVRIRSWLVTGVGTEAGIKLLGMNSQFTNTVYSKLTNALWDQTAMPWDRSEWDGFLPGVNPKEYVLQQPGAANRNAHSRSNVWIHKTAIQTFADFMNIKFSDIAKESHRAERPIVEFENTLELYNHGVQYRHWPTFLVNEKEVSIADFDNIPLTSKNTTTLDARYMALLRKLSRPVDVAIQTEIHGNLKISLDADTVTQAELAKILENLEKDNIAGRIPKYAVYKIVNNQVTWIKNAPTGNWIITYRVSGVALAALRILWLNDDYLKNKIVNIRASAGKTNGIAIEQANDGDAVVINVTSAKDPHYLHEYHWVDGAAVQSTFRQTATDLPKFEIYNSEGQRLSDVEAIIGYRPNIQYSNILRPKAGNVFDTESGYKLAFDSDQFTQLTEGNVAKDSMYNIVFEHTLQNTSVYTNEAGTQLRVYGPYSFRRYAGKDVVNELSNGYRRAWFKLKSWAIRSQEIAGATTIALDSTMWPTYDWAVKIDNGVGTVLHTDDFKTVVDNMAVAARGHSVKFKVYHNGLHEVATVKGLGIDEFSVSVVNGELEFVVPESAQDMLEVQIGFISFKLKLIALENDPRFVKVTLNGLPVDCEYNHNEYTVTVTGNGVVEIRHQGNNVTNDHLTTIPGLDYNPEQQDVLGNLTVARLVKGLKRNVEINTANGLRPWTETPQWHTLDGIYMADHSAMRSTWALMNLNPGLKDVVVNRSLSAWRWYRRFVSKIEELNKRLEASSQQLVDRALEELLVGVTFSSVDAVTGMAFVTNAMSADTFVSNNETTYTIPGASVYTGVFGNDHVYVYVNDSIQLNGVDYTIVNNTVEFTTAPAAGAVVTIYHAAESDIYTGIPASPTKLGLGGLYEPKLVTETFGNNSKTYIQRHDGSKVTAYIDPATGEPSASYVINAAILELEKRIFNGCLQQVGQVNRQRSYRNYDAAGVTESQARAQLEWYATNNIDFRSRSDFNKDDPWTWNYGGASWRRLYINMFGTERLHEAPWEAVGYDDKPTWWDTHYSWTDPAKRYNLEIALTFGIVNEPGAVAFTDPKFARNLSTYPVTADGKLQSPFEYGIASPTVSEAQQPWEIGSLGPAESAWRRSIAGAWSNVLHVIDRTDLVSEFFDSSINPFAKQLSNNSIVPKGTGSIAPDQFFQDRPTIGIGAVLFEGYREFNLLGESPLNELMEVFTKLEFSVGGFTDGNISIKVGYTKYQDSEYIPVEDFGLTLNKGVETEILRYTAVRIDKDDVGFRVYGFDPGQRFFKVLTPSAAALSSGFPSTKRQLVTPHGTFVEYLDWNTAPSVVPYGSYIANKQDLVTFLLGLGAYQQSKGLLLDHINDRGTITDWKQAAQDALQWIAEQWGTDNFCVVGVVTSNGVKFHHEIGAMSRLDASLGRTGKVLFANGRSATANELLITRDFEENVDKITPLTEQQIVFVDFRTQNYDHVIYVNNTTKFGDLVVDLQCGNRLEQLSLSGRRTYNWTGRPHARGIIPQADSVLQGFDTLVDDILTSQSPERAAFDTVKTEIARADVVPAKQSVVFDVIQDNTAAYLYRQGLQGSVGTNLAIDALFRNRNIDVPTSVQDIVVNEQWMFSNGEFGRTNGKTVWELELRREDVTSDRQVIRFKEAAKGVKDLKGDSIIDIVGQADPRWVSRPLNVNFGTISREDIDQVYTKSHSWLPSAGLADLVDTDVELIKLADLTLDKIKSVDKFDGKISISDVFSAITFNRYADYNQGDLAWNKGTLYRALERIVGSSTSAFDAAQWTAVPIDGTVLPSVWVSDYGFTLEQGIVASSSNDWTAGQSYNIGDVVLRNGSYYKCVVANAQTEFAKFAVAGAEVIEPGSGYNDGDTVSFISSTGSGAVGVVNTIGGYLKGIDLSSVNPAADYNIATTTIVDQTGELVATLNFSNVETPIAEEYKYVSSVNLNNGLIGNNYDPEYTTVTLTVGATTYPVEPVFANISVPVTIAGKVASVSVAAGGSGYAVGDVLTLTNAGTENSDAVFEVVEVASTTGTTPVLNQITKLKIVFSGRNYVVDNTYQLTGGSGTGATLKVTGVVNVPSQPLLMTNAISGVTLGTDKILTTATTGKLTVSRVPQVAGDVIYRRAFATVTDGKVTAVNLTGTGAGAVLSSDDIKVEVLGDGSGAKVEPVVVNRKIASFNIISQGTGYTFANIKITDANWAPETISNIDVNLVLATESISATYEVGNIASVDSIVATRAGFEIGQVLKVVDASGVGPTVDVTVNNTLDGLISSITLLAQGTGYETIPDVDISSTSGTGANVQASIDQYWEILPQGYGWNVLQAFAPMYIEEICPNSFEPGLNESKASFANPHRLIPGSYIVISGTGDGNYDTIHRVKDVVDDYNILIEARSTSDTIVYDAVAFALNSVKFNSDEELSNSPLTFSAGMKAYVDGGDIEGQYTVYTFNASGKVSAENFDKVIVNSPMVDSQSIYKAQLFDYNTRNLVQSLEVFDPYKGLTIDEVSQYIDYKQLPDPAVYNITDLGLADEFAINAWGATRVGTLWWDLDKVRYIEYEQYATVQDRAKHWGERFANSEVAVYEWTASDELPVIDNEPDARLDTSASLGGQIRYSAVDEIDPLSGATKTRYYFWKRHVGTVPAGGTRPYSAYAIESVLNNPDANGVAWFSPIDADAFVVANVGELLSAHSKLVLRVEKNETPEQVHNSSVLVTEGFAGDVINEYLFRQVAVSVAGRDNYRESYDLHEYVTGQSYSKGQYVYIESNGTIEYVNDYAAEDYPVLRKLDDARVDVKMARLSKDNKDHAIYFVAKDFTATSFASDIDSRFLVKSAVSALIKDPYENTDKWQAVINTRRRVPDSGLHLLRRYGNAYTPRPQSWFKDIFQARRTLVVAANEYLLNIDVVSKPNWDKYLRTYKPLHGPYVRDLTKFWTYVDYVVGDYVAGNEAVKLSSTAQISTLSDSVTNFAIVDSTGSVVEAYNKSGSNVELVYRKDGTIQFLNTIWNGDLGEAWDRARWDSHYWDEDGSEIIESIFKALRYSIFVGADVGYFNNLFFALVKESLSQIPYADWVSKTTYLNVTQTSNGELAELSNYYNKKAQLVNKYINEVKPYHSKIVESDRFNTTQEAVPVSVDESIVMTTWTYHLIQTENGDNITTEDGRILRTEPEVTVQVLTEGQG